MFPNLVGQSSLLITSIVNRELNESGLPSGCIRPLPVHLAGNRLCEINPAVLGNSFGLLCCKSGAQAALFRTGVCWVLQTYGSRLNLPALAKAVTEETGSDHLGSVSSDICHFLTPEALAKFLYLLARTEHAYAVQPGELTDPSLIGLLAVRQLQTV
ncbi:MAG: hypothetical protein WCW26_03720 [Candidatus Buchananbacteria bacterium]